MPIKGYNAATIRNDVYELAKKQALKDGISVSEFIAKAIERYVNRTLEREDTIRRILRVLEKEEMGR